MAGFRATGNNGCWTDNMIQPGDTLLVGDDVTVLTSTVGTTISASQMMSGYISRQGATTAGFTDTTDTAANILLALSAGDNAGNPVVVSGSSFRLRILNTTGYTQTLAGGTGVTLSTGTFTTPTANWRDFLLTVTNTTPSQTAAGTVTASSTLAVFQLPAGTMITSLPLGPNPFGVDIQPGASVTGTGIQANTTVAGVTMGQGGVVGVSLSQTATASGVVPLTFGPTMKIDSIGSGTN